VKNLILMKPAEKYLNKQSKQTASRILLAIYHLPKGNVKTFQNASGLMRLRVGDVRVIFTIEDKQITIYDINNRGDIYK